ncbi:2-polyprenyl-3-methyl-5-hydroxy-6-metoxy-1,4-benzoquinol methylase [Mesoflavibacter sabulilitoris]|uniref:Methyltransferase n=1 Tax=Mesoflavibacter zeaxanthinifaciens subsp. sabulilitoris TaxID=1520893 RepID=A0A2T1N6K2_9FLAO|nr:class I SAM-dependent methyltransferase [Mesoflavibacter zeaxanthinifaciens]MBB3123147.1 2-polyprenyl-3-methyl-5-hydroxy-6-metoxy-1,4-benzoquinol methylase [Mesoflavibacter zeaxanthinifaciens subsp. sabulilitoris]PSG87212.1 methyltransferase [Mesoflavibacter zeaxanthinifaciens subsp. sabulilitoris]
MSKEKTQLYIKDHSVSGEMFQLKENEKYGFLETFPQPKTNQLSEYYKTEDYISHTDAKRNWFEKAYHLVRRFSLKQKLKLINGFKTETKTLLDVGCGTGDFLKTAKDNNWIVSGIEPNAEARTIANQKTENAVFDIEQLNNFESNSFDVITLWHVLEHLPDLEYQISILKKLLKPKGRLVVAVPNYKSFDANYYNQFWAAYDVPRHLWHFDQNSISKLFASIDMEIEQLKPMLFDAFYVSLLSEQYKSGRKNIFKGFYNGLRSNLNASRTSEYSSLIYVLKNS